MNVERREIDLGDKMYSVAVYEIGGKKFVNGTPNAIDFQDGDTIEAEDVEFWRIFKVRVDKIKEFENDEVSFFKQKISIIDKNKAIVENVLKQLGEDVYVICSSKTAKAYKNKQLVIVERGADRLAEKRFEIVE